MIAIIRKLAAGDGKFDRVSVGFPGVTKNGVIYTAPNLGKGWNNFALEQKLRRALKRPVRVANDADVQGLGSVTGHGVELVITLGTGVGSVVFVNGNRIHLELGHHPFHKGKTYEDELGHRMLLKKGKKWWNKRLREAIEDLKTRVQLRPALYWRRRRQVHPLRAARGREDSQQRGRAARRNQALAGYRREAGSQERAWKSRAASNAGASSASRRKPSAGGRSRSPAPREPISRCGFPSAAHRR